MIHLSKFFLGLFLFGFGTTSSCKNAIGGPGDLTPVKLHGKCGFVDLAGRFVIRPTFEDADPFTEGLAMVLLNGKIGYIDKDGVFAISPQYTRGTYFSEGRAFVMVDNRGPIICIDQTGRCCFSYFDCVEYHAFSESKALFVTTDRKVGYIDIQGRRCIEAEFEDGKDFCEGLAAVQKGGLWGYVDKNGTMAIDFQFEDAGQFSEGLAPVKMKSLWGIIDKDGTWVAEPQYDDVGNFHEGCCPFEADGSWGYIDKRGHMIIDPKYDAAIGFGNGLAAVSIDGRWGFIDKKGGYSDTTHIRLSRCVL